MQQPCSDNLFVGEINSIILSLTIFVIRVVSMFWNLDSGLFTANTALCDCGVQVR